MKGRPSRIADFPLAAIPPRGTFVFRLRCIHRKNDYLYDYTELGMPYPALVDGFIAAIIARRNLVGHDTRKHTKYALTHFFNYLGTREGTAGEIRELRDLNAELFSSYAAWDRTYGSGGYKSKQGRFNVLTPLIEWMAKNYPGTPSDLVIEKNQFPMAHRTTEPRKPYSTAEWNRLLKAIGLEIRDAKRRLETPYVPKWKGLPPPLDGVAPFDKNKGAQNQHSSWDSDEHLIWWWENEMHCQCLNDYKFRFATHKAPSALHAIYKASKSGRWGARPEGQSMVDHFYTWIGAGDNYKPRYLGAPDPVKYDTKFHKPEYLEWYWENELNGRIGTQTSFLEQGEYGFFKSTIRLHGNLTNFYQSMGLHHKVTVKDLFPYFMLLSIRTALNPSTIQRLTIDCIRPAPGIVEADIEQPKMWMIDWEKIRSFSQGSTIPTHVRNELMPVSIILRVIQITSRYRGDRKDLWITEYGETIRQRNVAMNDFVRRHNLMDDPVDGMPPQVFSVRAARIRPTVAMREYVRTGNMGYVQTLLGHKQANTTVTYISQMDNPVLLTRRGIHQDAMFLDLTGDKASAIELLTSKGLAANKKNVFLDPDGECSGLLTSCRSPRKSPQPNQTEGKLCSSDACLSCQNLVVTNRDLHKYFCFMHYHDAMLASGDITEDDHYRAVNEAKYAFENFILPKFQQATIEWAVLQAEQAPLPEWIAGGTV